MKNWFRHFPQSLARGRKKHRVRKYPILLLLLLMAAACRGINGVGTLTRPAIRRRVLAAALTVCMVFAMMPMQAFAAEPMQDAGVLCEHHPDHTSECGYTEGTAGSPCTHEHTEDCYIEVTDCTHEHTSECYPEDDSVSDNDATPSNAEKKEPTECTHICGEDTGCITQELDCPHDSGEHDDTCGYAEGTEGTPCTYLCEICNPAEDDAEKQILAAAAPKAVTGTGWEIDGSGNLSISATAGMDDWVANGLGANKTTLKTVTVKETVTSIPYSAFASCKKLESVTAPGVTSIGNRAFYDCTALWKADFPEATSIGTHAFSGCEKFVNASFPAATSIGESAFYKCIALTSASFPKATTIDSYAFQNCTKLATLSLPASPPSVTDENAFQGGSATRALVLVDAEGNALSGAALNVAQGNCKGAADGNKNDNLWYGWDIGELTEAEGTNEYSIVAVAGGYDIYQKLADATWKKLGDASTEIGMANGNVDRNEGALGIIHTDNFLTAKRTSAVLWFGGSVSDGTYTVPTADAGTLDISSAAANIFDGMWTIKGRITGSGSKTLYFNSEGKAAVKGYVANTKAADNYGRTYAAISQSSNRGGRVTIADGAEIVGAACGISDAAANLDITGGKVTGGVYAVNNSKSYTSPINLSGSPVLTGGTATIYTGNAISAKVGDIAYAGDAITIDYGNSGPTAGTDIVTGVTADNKAKFSLTNPGWALAESGDKLVLKAVALPEAEWTPIGGTKASGSFADALTSMSANGGSIKLLTAVSTASTTALPAKAIGLDLNGQAWTGGGEVQVPRGCTLSVTDGVGSGGFTATASAGVTVQSGGTLDLQSGSITCTASALTGISNNGTVKLGGGTVTSTQATAINNAAMGKLYIFGTPTINSQGTCKNITCAAGAQVIANNGKTGSELAYFTGTVSVQYPKTSVSGYVAVSGLKDEAHSKLFTFNAPPAGLTFQYDDAAKTIKLAAPVVKGWKIDDNNLTITTQAGMADWVTNGKAANKTTVKTATIAEAVTEIASEAFYECTALTSVTAPGVTKIALYAFHGCTKLAMVNTPKAQTIGNYAFYGCALTSANFPEVTSIGQNAFTDCKALGSASFPTVQTIGLSAFASCSALSSASFPKVTSIGNFAFSGCTKLATLALLAAPPTVADANAFTNCPTTRALSFVDASGKALTGTALTTAQAAYKAVLDGNNTDNLWYGWEIADKGWKIDSDGSLTVSTQAGMTDWVTNGLSVNKSTVKTAAIDQAVISISSQAFEDCTALTTVNAPGVMIIASYAFHGCDKLTSVNIPKAESIGGTAFSGCAALTSVSFPSVINLGNYAFNGCAELAAANIPKAESIDNNAFDGCGALASADFPAATSIGEYAFNSCLALTSADFPAATSIGEYAFNSCLALTSVNFPEVTSIGKMAFYKCNALTKVSFPKATSIGYATFWGCTSLTSASFPAATSIAGKAFYGCTVLAKLALPAMPPAVANADAFDSRATTRVLTFMDASGTALTGTALATAQAAYNAVADGDTTDKLWYGWKTAAPPPATPTVTAVAVTPKTANVQKGKTQQFTTAVTGTNSPAQTVTWKVTGGKAGTSISTSGLLTVASDEAATILTITATSTVDTTKSGTATATVTSTPVTTYTITFNANGGSVSPSSAITGTDGKLASLPTPNRSGSYRFDGWFTAANGGTQVTTGTVFTSNDTIFAQWTYTGGGDSGDGGSIKPPTAQSTPPDQSNPSKGEATVTVLVDENGNASVTVTDNIITEAITQAKKGAAQDQPISVSIKVETDKAATQITATLPKTVQETLISNKVASVTIASNTVTMSFSQTAIVQMNTQAKADITITAAKADTSKLDGDAKAMIGNRPMYDFTATYGGGNTITSFGNNTVSITVPYTLGAGETAGNIQAVYVDDNGKATVIPNSNYDATQKAVIFVTSHFSGYGVGYKQAATSDKVFSTQ